MRSTRRSWMTRMTMRRIILRRMSEWTMIWRKAKPKKLRMMLLLLKLLFSMTSKRVRW